MTVDYTVSVASSVKIRAYDADGDVIESQPATVAAGQHSAVFETDSYPTGERFYVRISARSSADPTLTGLSPRSSKVLVRQQAATVRRGTHRKHHHKRKQPTALRS